MQLQPNFIVCVRIKCEIPISMEESYSRLYKALHAMFIFQPDFILPVKNDFFFEACAQQADVLLISYPKCYFFFFFLRGGGGGGGGGGRGVRISYWFQDICIDKFVSDSHSQ